MTARNIIVVGAGIIGSSIAYHLAQAGTPPLIVDAGEGGGVTTPTSWAWLNASWGNPEPYFRLRMRSMAQWHRLARELPTLPIHFRGSLTWDVPAEELARYVTLHAGWGYRIGLVGPDAIRLREPRLRTVPEMAALCEDEGAVEPLAAALLLREAAVGLGARQRLSTPVERLEVRGGRVTGVGIAGETLRADEVIVAAGNGSPSLLAGAGYRLPFKQPPGLLAHTAPIAPVLNGLIVAPGIELRQTAEGRLVAGIDFTGKLEGDRENSTRLLMERMTAMLELPAQLVLSHTTVGERPTPEDGFPVIGRPPAIAGLYIAVMHSGMTLAAGVGQWVSDEILAGRRDPLLGPYGPERFAAGS